MRRIAVLLALMVATTLLAAGVAFTQAPEEDTDPYIVVLKDGVDNPSQIAEGIDHRQEGFDAGFVYKEALDGFSAEIPDDSVDDVRNNRNVAYVERDKIVWTTDQVLPWGIDRINADLSSTQAGDGDGLVTNVHVYIIDTGIAGGNKAHPDLKVVQYVNKRGGQKDADCDGHGTHVAGILAARDNAIAVVGVAPGAPLTSVKVLNCYGYGTDSDAIAGIEWVTANAVDPAVANLSLTGGRSRALNTAVRNSAASGVFYSLAAGNQGRSACKFSPAMTGAGKNNGILTTAATDSQGKEARWSNFGSCVDLWAPGVKIRSTRLGGGTTTMSGTSMAAPHVGGAAALYLSTEPPAASPVDVESRLRSDSKLVVGHTSKNGDPIRRVDARDY